MRRSFGCTSYKRYQHVIMPPLVCYRCNKLKHIARNCRSNIDTFVCANSVKYFDVALAAQYTNYYQYNPWYMESEAIDHIVSKSSKFNLERSLGIKISEVKVGRGESHTICATDTSIVKTTSNDIKLSNVKYVLTMKKNLISVGSIINSRHIVVFSNTHCYVFDKENVIALDNRDPFNGLYAFGSNISDSRSHQANLIKDQSDLSKLWHSRFGHLSFRAMKYLHDHQNAIGLPQFNKIYEVCESCLTKNKLESVS